MKNSKDKTFSVSDKNWYNYVSSHLGRLFMDNQWEMKTPAEQTNTSASLVNLF